MCVAAELVNLLRIVINDLSDTQTYTDDRLSQALVAAMYYVAYDADISTYVPNASTIDIVPSPAGDVDIANLLILKANCLIDHWRARDAVRKSGVSFQEFSSRVDTKGIADAHLKLLQIGACKAYDEALFDYAYGDGSFGIVIMTPFRSYYSSDGYASPR